MTQIKKLTLGLLACVGGIVAAESMRASYVNLIPSTHNAQQRKTYTDNANLWGNVRNGCIAVAAAVYVWNVVDAITSKGARYAKQGSTGLALTPYASSDQFGLALSFNF